MYVYVRSKQLFLFLLFEHNLESQKAVPRLARLKQCHSNSTRCEAREKTSHVFPAPSTVDPCGSVWNSFFFHVFFRFSPSLLLFFMNPKHSDDTRPSSVVATSLCR